LVLLIQLGAEMNQIIVPINVNILLDSNDRFPVKTKKDGNKVNNKPM